ncbi:hypothetical protein AVEN_244874-1 [Araneus ventricosus]|uniref:Uncharacterized protein n=1 Tax=Araneus ventricosus TaxID=182803 RepID=A0A4Y2KYK9_ARAVE|nr:hypothetical protein AVEN_244874-1 [Araneus ventricosus]
MSLPLKILKSLVNQESFQLADLTSIPSSGRQRTSSTSPVQPSSTSIVSAYYISIPTVKEALSRYSCHNGIRHGGMGRRFVKDATIQDLFQNLQNIINGGTTTTTRGGNSKYNAHMSIEIAAELIKLVKTLERRFQTQQDSQPIILPTAPKDTADIGIDTKIDTTTI